MPNSIHIFKSLTDQNGIIQFSISQTPNQESGYAVEDQARALILSLKLNDPKLIGHYLKVTLAYIAPSQGVYMIKNKHSQMEPQKDNFAEASSEVVWALGTYLEKFPQKKALINSKLDYLLSGILKSNYPRVWAYTILGLAKISKKKELKILSNRLLNLYTKNTSQDWLWPENTLFYANALFPWSLIESFKTLQDPKLLQTAEEMFEFLTTHLTKNNVPLVVGNQGWWQRGQKMAIFDQQPIDVAYLVLALSSAYKITGNPKYLNLAKFYYSWFEGNNLLKVKMINSKGFCLDGLEQTGSNQNSGAESNICFLLAKQEISKIIVSDLKTK